MRIKVQSVGPVTKEKSYYFYTLNYSKDGKDEKRKIMSFTEVPYKAFKDAKEGDSFDVGLKKDDNGYWQWDVVTAVAEGAPPMQTNTTGKSGNWETSEERARRQILIIRQSSLAQAVAFVGRDGVPVADENIQLVLTIAGDFEAWVNRED